MGALDPLFLLAGITVAVPLFLHLFQRHQARRVAFPALRYLERTEREHARRIRFRQLILLVLRTAVVVVLVAAGARLFLRGRGSAHPPTALALILDNSMSSGRIVGERRVLDQLQAVALRTLAAAGDGDRVWVVRAGEPWLPSVPVRPEEAARIVRQTTVSAARGDLSAALSRAAGLVETSELPAKEIHLVSDLQATAFGDAVAPAGDLPVIVWVHPEPSNGNRALASVVVGGGLAPLLGQRTELTVGTEDAADMDTVPLAVRAVVDDRIRGAGSAPPGAAVSIVLPPTPAGWVQGYVDADPDAVRADDRRYFAFRARPAPTVWVAGDPGLFVREAVAVLEAAGRVRSGPPAAADLVISAAGEGLDQVTRWRGVLVVPPSDPNLLPALDRRLGAAGIPWHMDRAEGAGEVKLTGEELPAPLASVSVRSWYRVTPAGESPAPTRTLARAGDDPWALEGTDALGRRYLLLASPLDTASGTLPVSTGMVRFVDWVSGEWASSGGGPAEHLAGDPLPAPRAATRVRLPSGAEQDVDGARIVAATGEAGFYTFLAGDSVLAVDAVNPPPAESDLRPLAAADLGRAVGPGAVRVAREGGWGRAIFRTRQGPELWWVLLLAALALLLVEAGVAAAGRIVGRPRPSVSGKALRGAT
jgi:Aerotolerance regulator N-terminal